VWSGDLMERVVWSGDLMERVVSFGDLNGNKMERLLAIFTGSDWRNTYKRHSET